MYLIIYLFRCIFFPMEALKGNKKKKKKIYSGDPFSSLFVFSSVYTGRKKNNTNTTKIFTDKNKKLNIFIFLVLTLFTSIYIFFFSVFHSFVLSHVLYQVKTVSRTHSAGIWWGRTFAPCPSRELSCLPSRSSSSISSSANRGKNELFHIWLRKVSVHLKVTLRCLVKSLTTVVHVQVFNKVVYFHPVFVSVR